LLLILQLAFINLGPEIRDATLFLFSIAESAGFAFSGCAANSGGPGTGRQFTDKLAEQANPFPYSCF
jgi:hypothetical protein